MPFFPHASQLGIHDGNFVDNSVAVDNQFHAPFYCPNAVQGNGDFIGSGAFMIKADYQRATFNNYHGRQSGIDILRAASEPDAAYDSAARNPAPKCHPQTRNQYIEDFIRWAVPSVVATVRAPPLAWMKGHAGMGKTSIAQSCVEKLRTLSIPFAAFFFFYQDRNKPQRFFPTIAYQIAIRFPDYRNLIDQKILHDPTLVRKTPSTQFRELLMLPLQELMTQGRWIGWRFPIFVDGLDECHGRDAQRQIVEIIEIAAEAARTTNLPLCWAFFSRPEPHITAAFAKITVSTFTYTVTLRKSVRTKREIELYLRESFEGILQRRNLSLSVPWPSEPDIKRLVEAADGMFIYGATALRFIDNPQWLDLNEPLRLILDSATDTEDPSYLPFANLDALYLRIMQRIPHRALPLVTLVLTLLCRQKSAFDEGGYGASMLGNCLGMSEMEVRAVCGHLSSVLLLHDKQEPHVLPNDIDITRPFLHTNQNLIPPLRQFVWWYLGGSIDFLHKSFYDFLSNSSRSGPYCTTTSAAYDNLLARLLDIRLRYEESYVIHNLRPVHAPGIASSAFVSFPAANEFTSSLLLATAYDEVRGVSGSICNIPSVSLGLRKKYDDCDQRKGLYILTSLYPNHVWISGSILGCHSYGMVPCRGIQFSQIQEDFANFDVEWFLRTNNSLRAITLSKIPGDVVIPAPRTNCESGVNIHGHGEKTIFDYWEIDLVECFYRSVRCIDLASGIELFQAERSWP